MVLKWSVFGDRGERRELAVAMVPGEGTGDEQTDQTIACANVGELFWCTLPQLQREIETLEVAYENAGIDRRYLPGKIQSSDALRAPPANNHLAAHRFKCTCPRPFPHTPSLDGGDIRLRPRRDAQVRRAWVLLLCLLVATWPGLALAAPAVQLAAGVFSMPPEAGATIPGVLAETAAPNKEPIPSTDLAPRAAAAVLMDAASGQVLWAKNPNQRRPAASITKLMTIAMP